ncbi:MAG: alpha/beta hydrolase [Acidimicrobiia bacterium]
MGIVKVNGVELECRVLGSGEPVLLIDPALPDAFLPVLEEPVLADRFQLITYRKRGWGGSTHAPGPVSIEDHAADAAALLGHFGIARAHIVGHSSGALVAMQLALDAPELVHSLALLEPSAFVVPIAPAFLEEAGPVFAAHDAGDHEGAVAGFLSAVSGLDWGTCRAVIDEHAPGAVVQAVKDADTFFGVELPSLTVWAPDAELMAAISQPVLSVLGTRTQPLWVEVAEQLHTWFPQVEDLSVEGAGHLLQVQQPEPVARGVAEFLGRHPLSDN